MSEFAGRLTVDRTPFFTEERCFISEWFNHEASSEASLAQCRVAPDVTTQLHALGVAERYIVTQGRGLMELNRDDRFVIESGDVVVIPADCPQRVKNLGQDDLVFLCLCTPRFEPGHYINLEDDQTPELGQI